VRPDPGQPADPAGPRPAGADPRRRLADVIRRAGRGRGHPHPLRPELTLEIGTAEGGCLERIAADSAEVHSIDLGPEPVTRPLPAHVVLHTGSSRELLTPLLASFAQAGRGVDFALVDGDHSYDGVRADLTLLLDSPVTARSVLLVHDTMNAEIRAGIESRQLESGCF